MDHVATNSIYGFRGAFYFGEKITQVDLDPHRVESPYTHAIKTKIGGIESPVLGALNATKISRGNHPYGTHQAV